MNFIYFVIFVCFFSWATYEIVIKESTLFKTFFKNEEPTKYWLQIFFTYIISLIAAYMAFFK